MSRTSRKRSLRPPLQIKIDLKVVEASDSREIEVAFATLIDNRVDALVVGTDSLFFDRPHPDHHAGRASRAACHLQRTRLRRSRRLDELRNKLAGSVSASRRLCRPNYQGRKSPPTCPWCNRQIRIFNKSADCARSWPQRPSDIARPRRRGDRVRHSMSAIGT